MHLFQQHPFPQQQFLFDLYAGLGHCPTDPTSDGPLILKALSRHSVDTMFPLQPKIFVKFIYSEKARKLCEISTLLLSVCTVDKSKVEISQIFWPSQNIRTLLINNDLVFLMHNCCKNLCC